MLKDKKTRANLFILGAPKCGTTSLSWWLGQHPDVFLPEIKEPHLYYSPYPHKISLEKYERLYEESISERYRIDASVWYLFSNDAVEKILSDCEDAKFIVCLRNPIEMAPSLHAQILFTGYEKEKNFRAAWRLAEERESGKPVKAFNMAGGDLSYLSYRKTCKLGEQVARLLELVSEDRVIFVFLDDLREDRDKVWKGLLCFLGLDDCNEIDFAVRNKATKRRSNLLNRIILLVVKILNFFGFKGGTGAGKAVYSMNTKESAYEAVPIDLIEEMKNEFGPDVELLSKLTGRELGSWLK
ncbi:sulfotransferase domain-containing protein [Alcanivorax sp.]|jgi:hypothetical protein|uniref:sulfotransferase domain-containing protein n=1 Tax=Alcanivorax sp. TaxID=1872427 RepID=UPI00258E9E9C|nr:sulfotransferase domain-containing protein [Alcanivorax sp.]